MSLMGLSLFLNKRLTRNMCGVVSPCLKTFRSVLLTVCVLRFQGEENAKREEGILPSPFFSAPLCACATELTYVYVLRFCIGDAKYIVCVHESRRMHAPNVKWCEELAKSVFGRHVNTQNTPNNTVCHFIFGSIATRKATQTETKRNPFRFVQRPSVTGWHGTLYTNKLLFKFCTKMEFRSVLLIFVFLVFGLNE